MMSEIYDDDQDFFPCAKAMECLEQAEWLEDLYKPTKPEARPKKKPPKKKAKQMSIKRAIKNMKEKNFQGYDIERCTVIPSLNNSLVYLPKNYGAKTRKRFKNRHTPSAATAMCNQCFLMPCSMIEYRDELLSTMTESEKRPLPPDEVLDKVRTRYRFESMKRYCKSFVLKQMPTNIDIPMCALSGTRELVNDTGYDSLDDTPSEHDGKLNERDNDRELDEYRRAGWQPSDADDEDDSSETSWFDENLPLSSLLEKSSTDLKCEHRRSTACSEDKERTALLAADIALLANLREDDDSSVEYEF